jgi:hypothetical protein
MTSSILADDKETTLESSVVGKNTDKPIPDPSWLAHDEPPEAAEYLFIGAPPGSSRRRVHYAAGLSVLAAVALTTWLLPGGSNSETDLLPLISSTAAPQAAVLAPGQGERRRIRHPPSSPWRHTPSSARTPHPVRVDEAHVACHRLFDLLRKQPNSLHCGEIRVVGNGHPEPFVRRRGSPAKVVRCRRLDACAGKRTTQRCELLVFAGLVEDIRLGPARGVVFAGLVEDVRLRPYDAAPSMAPGARRHGQVAT